MRVDELLNADYFDYFVTVNNRFKLVTYSRGGQLVSVGNCHVP